EYLRTQVFEPLGMVDTTFQVPAGALERCAANSTRRAGSSVGTLEAQPVDRVVGGARGWGAGGGGAVSAGAGGGRGRVGAGRGGELEGKRLLGRRTVAYMTTNHLPEGRDLASLAMGGSFSETRYEGVGFGLGFSVLLDAVRAQTPGAPGEYGWGGMASTAFW